MTRTAAKLFNLHQYSIGIAVNVHIVYDLHMTGTFALEPELAPAAA